MWRRGTRRTSGTRRDEALAGKDSAWPAFTSALRVLTPPSRCHREHTGLSGRSSVGSWVAMRSLRGTRFSAARGEVVSLAQAAARHPHSRQELLARSALRLCAKLVCSSGTALRLPGAAVRAHGARAWVQDNASCRRAGVAIAAARRLPAHPSWPVRRREWPRVWIFCATLARQRCPPLRRPRRAPTPCLAFGHPLPVSNPSPSLASRSRIVEAIYTVPAPAPDPRQQAPSTPPTPPSINVPCQPHWAVSLPVVSQRAALSR